MLGYLNLGGPVEYLFFLLKIDDFQLFFNIEKQRYLFQCKGKGFKCILMNWHTFFYNNLDKIIQTSL